MIDTPAVDIQIREFLLSGAIKDLDTPVLLILILKTTVASRAITKKFQRRSKFARRSLITPEFSEPGERFAGNRSSLSPPTYCELVRPALNSCCIRVESWCPGEA
jgi:hypothetical protein